MIWIITAIIVRHKVSARVIAIVNLATSKPGLTIRIVITVALSDSARGTSSATRRDYPEAAT